MSTDGASAAATEVANRFLTAIYEGDSELIWDLFARAAREYVITRGMRRGMAAEPAQAILTGTADELERGEFLGDLLAGLEKDLETVDLGRVVIADEVEVLEKGRARVRFLERFVVPVGPQLDPLPVGSIEMVEERGAWRVERLVPKP